LLPPNVIVVLTDDQTVSSLAGEPPAMPWLGSQLSDPSKGWLSFTDAVVSTPFCCPSRATILTGGTAWRTGVVDNSTGYRLDETQTIATWLQGAGYRTAMIGKYLNEYPWDRGPYVPPGWDRWLAKTNESEATTYYDYPLVDEGRWRRAGSAPGDYVTDLLSHAALDFVRTTPADRPYFLYFAPPAPHRPATPSPVDSAVPADAAPAPPSEAVLNDVAGKPSWVRSLPPVDAEGLRALQAQRAQAQIALRPVDRFLEQLFDVLAWRGDLDRTVVVFLSDNGYAFGEHRWVGKLVPYEPSIRVPFAIRTPWASGATVHLTVSNADVAPTIAALAGVSPGIVVDGESLAPLLRGIPPGGALAARAIVLGWVGTSGPPPWVAVRTRAAILIRWAGGTEELYDLVHDPGELRNLAGDPAFSGLRDRMRTLLPPPLAPSSNGG
jgi:arylsulfatase A-like enzyme